MEKDKRDRKGKETNPNRICTLNTEWKIFSFQQFQGKLVVDTIFNNNGTTLYVSLHGPTVASCQTIQIARFNLVWMCKVFYDLGGLMEVWFFHHLIMARKFSSA